MQKVVLKGGSIIFFKRNAMLVLLIKPRFSIGARSEDDQEIEDVREKAKIVRKA